MRDIPPGTPDAEASLLGAMLLSAGAVHDALRVGLEVGDFYATHHATIGEAIMALHTSRDPVDAVTVSEWLRQVDRLEEVGGTPYLLEMTNTLPSVAAAEYYAKKVIEASIKREVVRLAAQIAEIGYHTADVERALGEISGLIRDLVSASDRQLLRGYHDDSRLLNIEADRDLDQPWIARGVLRRKQRCLVAARAGIGKSVLLRQMAFCCVNGVHPYTGQRTEVPRESLMVELEAGEWDISSSMNKIGFALQRILDYASVWDLNWPALLHRPGGLDLRTPTGYATLEAAIRRAQPELVVIGPLKYLSIAKPGENYEIAALNLMGLLNELMDRYQFALVIEAHFSRNDRGAPGGSERWVDWPDAGFGIHPPSDDLTQHLAVGGNGVDLDVKQFRIPRDSDIWIPSTFVRGREQRLPWSIKDEIDPYRPGAMIFASRFGGRPAEEVGKARYDQGEF